MKLNRFIWLALWILSIVGISFYGGPISFGFFWTMTFIPVVSFLYLILVYIFFKIYQKIELNAPVAGEPVAFYFRLVDEYFFAFMGVRVRFYTKLSYINGLLDETEYELHPGSDIKRETTLVCRYRGEYEVGIRRVEICDYFRLFRLAYQNKEALRVTVKPKTVILDELKSIDLNHVTRESRKNASYPDILTRAYNFGDDIRQVHWSQTARTGELTVREKTGEEKEGISILTDTFRYSDDRYVYLPSENKVLEIAIAISLYMAKRGIPVYELHLSGKPYSLTLPDITGFSDYYDCMSEIVFGSVNTHEILFARASENPDIMSSRLVFFILQKWTGEAKAMVSKLSFEGVYCVVYLVADSIESDESLGEYRNVDFIKISPEDDLKEVL